MHDCSLRTMLVQWGSTGADDLLSVVTVKIVPVLLLIDAWEMVVHNSSSPNDAMIALGRQVTPGHVHDAGGLCTSGTLPAGTSTFAEMYASDGNHPSNAGTYLEGLIIASSITGETSHSCIMS